MKTPLLAISLAANVALAAGVGYMAFAKVPPRPAGETTTGASFGQSKRTGAAEKPIPAVILPTAPPPNSWQSPTDLNAWLLSTHAPLKVRYEVTQVALSKKHGALIEAFRYPPTMKRWQRSSTRPTPEQREQQAALWRQGEEEMKQLFGADYEKARYDDYAAGRMGLSVEKFAAIQQVNQDYAQLRFKQLQNGLRVPGAQQLMDAEMTTDLANILTPAEFEVYQAYESEEAHRVQSGLIGLDVDDETYLRAYRALAGARAANPQAGYEVRRDTELQTIEKAVGPEIARHVAMNHDGNFGEFNRVFLNANLTPAARYEKYQTFTEFHEVLGRLRSTMTQGKLDGAYQARVRTAYERLTAGLPPAARAAFDRTPTGTTISQALAQPLP